VMDSVPGISDDVGTMVRPEPMSESDAFGGDLQGALENVAVPSYIIDKAGVIRWVNAAAMKLLGDVRGRQFTSVVAPEETRRARELFTRKILGAASATEAEGAILGPDRSRVTVEVCAVPLKSGDRIIGVFGQLIEHEGPTGSPHPGLTPRQVEVLRLLERGLSTKQIAQELHLSTETVKNHIRGVFRALGVNSRLEAVAVARRGQAPDARVS
jgi:PAS domain S-box-containing protein